MSNVVSIHTKAEEAWDQYARAARRAQETLDAADGIAAGKAWARFLDTQVNQAQRDWLYPAGVVKPCR